MSQSAHTPLRVWHGRDDVIRREQVIDEPQVLEDSEDFDDALMVDVSLRDQREEESRIEERHTFGWP